MPESMPGAMTGSNAESSPGTVPRWILKSMPGTVNALVDASVDASAGTWKVPSRVPLQPIFVYKIKWSIE